MLVDKTQRLHFRVIGFVGNIMASSKKETIACRLVIKKKTVSISDLFEIRLFRKVVF